MERNKWIEFGAKMLLTVACGSVGVFVAVRAAVARDGVAGGPARTHVTVAGTVTGGGVTPGSMQTMTFAFRRQDGASLCAPRVSVMVEANGAFVANVPVDDSVGCPETMFSGADLLVDVYLGADSGAPIVAAQVVNPVPFAHFASQYGSPLCPVGYLCETEGAGMTCDPASAPPRGDARVRCVKRARESGVRPIVDEVVRVGSGATVFWIDRFEATVWTTATPVVTDVPLNSTSETDLTTLGLPRTGDWQGRAPRLFSASLNVPNPPSRWVTWFQAQELCRASGKRLPTGEEWLAAARGTRELGCHIAPPNLGPRYVDNGTSCVSEWGARDLVGNLSEWTSEWYAGLVVGGGNDDRSDWPSDYGNDGTRNITASVFSQPTSTMRNSALPAAAQRGGAWDSGTLAGRFALHLSGAPSNSAAFVGFRCVIPR